MPDTRATGALVAASLITLATLSIALPARVGAASIYHCVGADGSEIFSEHPCGPDAEVLSIESQERISGPGETAPNAIEQLRNYRQNVRDVEELVGKEASPRAASKAGKADPCAGVTSLQMRNARVGKRVIKCHSKNDVRAILGDPQSIYTWSDNKSYDTRWTYQQGDDWQYIFFKENRVTRLNTRNNQ